MAKIELSSVEILALKKIGLISYALAQSLSDKRAAKEQLALTSVVTDIVARAEGANPSPDPER